MAKPRRHRAKAVRSKPAQIKTARGKSATSPSKSRVRTAKVPKSSRDKVRAYRQRMRAKGLRLVQMWLPDTRTPEFAAEAHRQSLLANNSPFAVDDQAWVDSISDRHID